MTTPPRVAPAADNLLLLHDAGSWQQQLQEAIRSVTLLAQVLDLDLEALPVSAAAAATFPLLVPRAFASRMRRGDPADPLLRQVLATRSEEQDTAGFTVDPVAEQGRYAGDPGVLHKYSGRALLIATGQCAVNCRYCFRRHFPYDDNALSRRERQASIDRLLNDADIHEIILSGGDPLLLSDRELAAVATRVASARRPVTLRIHTRLPIVIPDRVTPSLLDALGRHDLRTVIVLHSNHPNELDAPTSAAIGRLAAAGITVLNQAVLLAGVNDDADTLAALSDALFAARAMPYYLHQLDRVAGAAHFAVPDERAQRLVGQLAALRPGYLVPRLMREVPGAASKRELPPQY